MAISIIACLEGPGNNDFAKAFKIKRENYIKKLATTQSQAFLRETIKRYVYF